MRFYDHIVVIRETDNLNDEAPSNQGTDDAAWALIEEDLLYAGSALPIKWEDSNAGRATKGAAMAMLAKVYLTQAGWPWNKSRFLGKGSFSKQLILLIMKGLLVMDWKKISDEFST